MTSPDNLPVTDGTAASVTAALLDQTIAMIAARGADDFSLRTVAAAAGCSTAYIFQKFGNKEGLIAATVEAAIAGDAAFHTALSADVDPLVLAEPSLADFIAGYVEQRARNRNARFLSSIAITGSVGGARLLASWHTARMRFWHERTAPFGGSQEVASIVAAYVAMEEYYAFALHDRVRYGLLLRETCRALVAAVAGRPPPGGSSANLVTSLNAIPLPPASPARDGPGIREQLLDYAVDEIAHHGIAAVNQRKITRRAKVSGSTIAYHFGDMARFVNEAIWRALIQDIPRELDPTRRLDEQSMTISAWLTSLSDYLHPARDGQSPGFYTSYARITAQACLLARTQPELMPLVAYLRELDGWGTYRAGRHIAQTARVIRRDQAAAFGIWIKAIAVLQDAGISAEIIDVRRLLSAAKVILALKVA